jgi:hypothetical protein
MLSDIVLENYIMGQIYRLTPVGSDNIDKKSKSSGNQSGNVPAYSPVFCSVQSLLALNRKIILGQNSCKW